MSCLYGTGNGQSLYEDCMKEAERLKEAAKKAELSTIGYISVGFFGYGNGYANAYQDAANAAAAKLSECGRLLTSLQLDSKENLASFDGGAKDLMADNTKVGDGATNVVKTLPYVEAGVYAVGGAGIAATGIGGALYGAGALAGALATGGGLGMSVGAAGQAALIADEAAKNPNRMPQIDHYAVGGSALLGTALGGLFPLVAGSAAIVGTAGYGSAAVASTESLAHYLDGEYYQAVFQAANAVFGFATTPYAVSEAREAKVMAAFKRAWDAIEAPAQNPSSAPRSIGDIVDTIKRQPAHYAEQPGPSPRSAEDYSDMLPSAAGVHTRRESEFPYRYPPSMTRDISPSNPLDVKSLELDQTYLWLVDRHGKIRLALEKDPGFRATYTDTYKGKVVPTTAEEAAKAAAEAAIAKLRTTVKHGDLVPAHTDAKKLTADTKFEPWTRATYRGLSRAAGELRFTIAPDGTRCVEVNLGSSRTFANLEGVNYLNNPQYNEAALGFLGMSLRGYDEMTLWKGATAWDLIPEVGVPMKKVR